MTGPAILSVTILVMLATPALAQTALPAAEPERKQEMVCRKDRETGSLVKVKKTCHTRAQWQYIDAENQKFSRSLVDDTRSRVNGN